MRFPSRGLPIILFFSVLIVFLILFVRYQRLPLILSLDQFVIESGGELSIKGRFFGKENEKSRVLVDDSPLTSAAVLGWEDREIRIKVPKFDGAVMVRVRTRSGVSKGVLLAESHRFPRVEPGFWLPGSPFLEFVEPRTGGIGILVTLSGEGFGKRQRSGSIWMNRNDYQPLLGSEPPNLDHYVEVKEIKEWSDRRILFWTPSGFESGSLYVRSASGFSNPVHFERLPGKMREGPRTTWSLRQNLYVDRVGALPGNVLYLHVPRPVPGAGQGEAVVLDTGDGPLRSHGFLDIFRLNELVSGERYSLSRQLVVNTMPLRADFDPGRLKDNADTTRPVLAAALAEDSWVKPRQVRRMAASAAGSVRGNWNKARALYNTVMNLLRWDASSSHGMMEAIETETAGSKGYSLLFCSLARAQGLPARPVVGILILEDLSTMPWWWAEFWLEGVGWVPADPALADSAETLAFPFVEDPKSFYFGNLDAEHIAFSRGLSPVGPLQPHPEFGTPEEFYSLQEAWEEASGNLASYRSAWPPPRVTAVYPSPEEPEDLLP